MTVFKSCPVDAEKARVLMTKGDELEIVKPDYCQYGGHRKHWLHHWLASGNSYLDQKTGKFEIDMVCRDCGEEEGFDGETPDWVQEEMMKKKKFPIPSNSDPRETRRAMAKASGIFSEEDLENEM